MATARSSSFSPEAIPQSFIVRVLEGSYDLQLPEARDSLDPIWIEGLGTFNARANGISYREKELFEGGTELASGSSGHALAQGFESVSVERIRQNVLMSSRPFSPSHIVRHERRGADKTVCGADTEV